MLSSKQLNWHINCLLIVDFVQMYILSNIFYSLKSFFSSVCDPPASLEHGTVLISSDKLTASYSCDVGYSLSGPEIRQCRTNGSWWDGTSPACSK